MKKYTFYSKESNINIKNYTLNKYINNVYGWMSCGLLITATTSWIISANTYILEFLMLNKFIILFAILTQVAIAYTISNMINMLTVNTATTLFIFYSVLTGLTTSGIFSIYTYSSITTTFLITSLTFGTMSVWGGISKQDLSKLGNIITMMLIGIVLSTIINIFLKNTFLTWITSYLSIFAFSILTAWDTQKIKNIGENIISEHHEQIRRYSILGALMLYIDFINLYLSFLNIIGTKISNTNEEN